MILKFMMDSVHESRDFCLLSSPLQYWGLVISEESWSWSLMGNHCLRFLTSLQESLGQCWVVTLWAGVELLQVKPKEMTGHSRFGLWLPMRHVTVLHKQGHGAPLQRVCSKFMFQAWSSFWQQGYSYHCFQNTDDLAEAAAARDHRPTQVRLGRWEH